MQEGLARARDAPFARPSRPPPWPWGWGPARPSRPPPPWLAQVALPSPTPHALISPTPPHSTPPVPTPAGRDGNGLTWHTLVRDHNDQALSSLDILYGTQLTPVLGTEGWVRLRSVHSLSLLPLSVPPSLSLFPLVCRHEEEGGVSVGRGRRVGGHSSLDIN